MSAGRLVLVLCLLASSGAHAESFDAWFDAQGRPSEVAQQAVQRAGLPRLVEGAPFVYPSRAKRTEGTACVTLQFLIRKDGVTDKFVVLDSKSTLDSSVSFDASVLRSLKFWKFEPPAAPVAAILPIQFSLAPALGSRIGRPAPSCEVPTIRLTGINLDVRGQLPFYPPELVRKGTEGCVTIAFKVQPNGLADEYGAYDAAPDDAFVGPAVHALNDWRFDGVAAGKQGFARFEFGVPSSAGEPRPCRWPNIPNLAAGQP